MTRHEFQAAGGSRVLRHPSPTSLRVADYLSGSSTRPPRDVEDPVDWMLRGRRLQARAMGDALERFGHALGALFAGVWNMVIGQYREREAMRALDRLDDHLLRDIGIRRSDIPLVVRGLVRPSTERSAVVGRVRCAEEVAEASDHSRLAA